MYKKCLRCGIEFRDIIETHTDDFEASLCASCRYISDSIFDKNNKFKSKLKIKFWCEFNKLNYKSKYDFIMNVFHLCKIINKDLDSFSGDEIKFYMSIINKYYKREKKEELK